MPNLLVAPKAPQPEQADTDIPNDGNDKSRGYYADGAYVAAPTLGPSLPANATSPDLEQDPQDAYYTRLHLRFSLLRATLRCAPPASAIAALDDDHPISLPSGSKHAHATWRGLLQSTDPLPAQLASLDHGSALRLIQIFTLSLKRGSRVGRRIGAWAWGLLGRVRDVGECGSEEVGILRDLGKRAVWVLKGLRARDEARANGDLKRELDHEDDEVEEEYGGEVVDEVQAQDDAVPEELQHVDFESHLSPPGLLTEDSLPIAADYPATNSKPIHVPKDVAEPIYSQPEADITIEVSDDHEADELAVAKERVRAQLDETETQEMYEAATPDRGLAKVGEGGEGEDVTLATLDMILTVVGEFYGQRDLLEFRDLWEEGL